MAWFAFGLLLAVSLYLWWRAWRDWIAPWGELEEIVKAITGGVKPRTYLLSGGASARRVALALEEIALREGQLRARAEEAEFGAQAIIGALPDGLVVVDEERRIRLMNRSFRRLFRLADDAQPGTLLQTVRDAAVEQSLGKTLQKDGPAQAPLTIAHGEQQLEVIAEAITGEDAKVRGAVVLFRDVTKLHQTEALRRDFVANVSHELRTPLSILRGYLETLLEDPQQPPAELLRIFEVMERHSNRLTLLVDDVLSLARLEGPGVPLSLTDVKLSAFLAEIMREWEKRFASKNLRAELDAPENLPPIPADAARLQELIYNLLDNAVKYSRTDGAIVVSARDEGAMVRVSVRDNGIGIPARDLPRIFERFYRADKARGRERGGTGLGLAIVKHIAQLHGGRVEATSELGEGTTISVLFPRQRASEREGACDPPVTET